MSKKTDTLYDEDESYDEATRIAMEIINSVQMGTLLLSIIFNLGLFTNFTLKKKYKKTFNLAYLNQTASDIVQALTTTTITLPGWKYDSQTVFPTKYVVHINRFYVCFRLLIS